MIGGGRRGLQYARASKHGADARNQFPRAERLGDVVIGADGESEYGVDLGVTCGEHDDVGIREGAQLPAHFQAVDSRQAEVQDDHIGVQFAGNGDRVETVGGHGCLELLALQVAGHDVGQRHLVIDDECPVTLRLLR